MHAAGAVVHWHADVPSVAAWAALLVENVGAAGAGHMHAGSGEGGAFGEAGGAAGGESWC